MSKQPVGYLSGKRILSLDLGRRTGWSVLVPSGPERHRDSGVFELYSTVGIKEYEDGERFIALERFLFELDQACGGFDVVAFEQVNGGTKGRQTTLWNGYRAMVMAWCARTGKRCLPIPIQTIKTRFAGKGNASKEEVEAECVERGYLPFDDNEADAIATMHTASALSDDPVDMERQLKIATQMDLGQFKMLVVEKKSRRKKICAQCTKDAPSQLTMERPSSNMDNERTKEERACSSGSAANVRQGKRMRQTSLSPSTDSPVQSSQRRSRAPSVTPTA